DDTVGDATAAASAAAAAEASLTRGDTRPAPPEHRGYGIRSGTGWPQEHVSRARGATHGHGGETGAGDRLHPRPSQREERAGTYPTPPRNAAGALGDTGGGFSARGLDHPPSTPPPLRRTPAPR
ncbi:MAG: hypothetical protein RKL32_03255, partial [Gammaproteobacteria bacterium]